MKTITVDFSSSKPVQPFYGGEVGENRAVYLDIIPSTDMSEDEDIAIYYVAFTVEGGIILSETFNQGEDISISLGSVITEQRKVFFQLIATSSDGESVISKSPIVQLFLGRSITGDVIPDPDTGDTIYTEIARLVEAAEHIDLSEYYTKSEVDAIAITKVDKVQGKGLSTEDYTTAEKTKLETVSENANANVIESIATADGSVLTPVNKRITLPATDSSMVEIRQGTNVSKFTASEISEMYANNTPMCYGGTPITSVLIVSLAGGTKEAYLGILYGGTTVTEAQTLKINENKQITVYENGTTITEAESEKLAGIEAGAEKNTVIDVLDSDGNSVVGADRKARLPQGGGGTITDVQDEQGNSLVNEGIATIPKEVVEIYNGGTLIGTLAEINEMRKTKELKYQGYEFVYINLHTSSPNTYAVYYIRPSSAPNRPSLYMDIFNANYEITGAQEKVAEWSDENFSTAEKNKLNGIATGAEVNVIDTIKDSNGNPLTVTSKAVTLPASSQVQVDYGQSDSSAVDYIKNKPDLSVYALSASLGAVATSNDYDDLDNKPTIPDISGKEDTANKVTSLSSSSTDTEYPSAKAVYDFVDTLVGNADTLLGSGVIS